MLLPQFIARDRFPSPERHGTGTTCRTGISWFRWCPVDIFFCVLIAFFVSFLLWKVCRKNLVSPGSPGWRFTTLRPSFRLTLPLFSRTSQTPSTDKQEAKFLNGNTTDSHPLDPYLVVNNIDNSLISKDPLFQGASLPQLVREQKRSGQLVGLGIKMSSHESLPGEGVRAPVLKDLKEDLGIDALDVSTRSELTVTPPPAYVRNPRWDT